MIRNSFSLLNVNCKQTHINNLNLVWEIELKSLELQTMKQLKNIVFATMSSLSFPETVKSDRMLVKFNLFLHTDVNNERNP